MSARDPDAISLAGIKDVGVPGCSPASRVTRGSISSCLAGATSTTALASVHVIVSEVNKTGRVNGSDDPWAKCIPTRR
jgi:hypothetical protein